MCKNTLNVSKMTFGESTMNRTQVQLQYNRLKKGREDVNDDVCPGCPRTSTTDKNIKAVKKIISDNRRTTIRQIDDDFWHIVRLMPSNLYGCFSYKTCESEDCSKIAKF